VTENNMENKYRWPKKGDNPFSAKNSGSISSTWCSLSWLVNFHLDDVIYSDAFKKGSDKIIEELSRGGNSEHPDRMFLPITYLYRHCLELKMKSVIRKGLELDLISMKDDKITEVMEMHNLHKIWNVLKEMIVARWPNGDTEALCATEKVILDFHEVDSTGQNLRYSNDKQGNQTSNSFPEAVELGNLKNAVDGVSHLLDGCYDDFFHTIEIKNEIENEYRGY